MLIGKTDLNREVYIIAEIGGNHNGSPEAAYTLVEAAAKAGANAVKFQTYRAETLVHPDMGAMPNAPAGFTRQFDRFKSLELPWDVYERIIAMCGELGIDFMTTPFDLEALERLAPFMPAVKVASGDLTYGRLISAAAATGKPVILSTGLATPAEIAEAAGRIPPAQRALLHCVSVYHTPDEIANLRAITSLKTAYPDSVVGYSDHTIGAEACLAAAAMGAQVLEKHFTLDIRQERGDHRLSLDPNGMAAMVGQVRRISAMLGDGAKVAAPAERDMEARMRRGVYAVRDLPVGHVLAEDDLLVVRPPTPLTPNEVPAVIGRRLARPLPAMAGLERSAFE